MRTHALRCLTILLTAALAHGQDARDPTGFPTDAAAQRARDEADLQRAVTAYRFWYPTVSLEGLFNGRREQGFKTGETITILSAQPHHLIFTANSDTPYAGGSIDLKRGRYVIDLPPGPFVGVLDDHHQGWITDLGLPGPDKGKGGKYLILPPDDSGSAVTTGETFVAKSRSYKVLIAIRALPVKGDVSKAEQALRSIKIYPLEATGRIVPMRFADTSADPVDSTLLRWEDNLQYWEKLHEVIDAEPLVEKFRPMYGLLAAIGIEKGKPFAPDVRLKRILVEAAKAGREQMLAAAFASVRPDRLPWKDRRWEWAVLVYDNASFETKTGLDLEARDRWFAQAILSSPAMFRRKEGSGSLYWLGHRDSAGAFLNGGKNYRLVIPQPVPAKLFWSLTLYDAATRSQIQTAQHKAALRSLFELKDKAGAKSLDLYFGPTCPAGKEDRWIQTNPGRGWFAYFRIFGPEKPAFDGTWKPGDIEEMK